MDPPPDMVYRRLNFVHGVPEEYHWATGDPIRRKNGGHGIQRMSVETWLEMIEEEQTVGPGDLRPCMQQLPRPNPAADATAQPARLIASAASAKAFLCHRKLAKPDWLRILRRRLLLKCPLSNRGMLAGSRFALSWRRCYKTSSTRPSRPL